MNRPPTMPLIAAALLMCCAGCVTAPPPAGAPTQAEARASIRAACPTPSTEAAKDRIADELQRAISAGAPTDTLAVEWARLNAAARICRGEA